VQRVGQRVDLVEAAPPVGQKIHNPRMVQLERDKQPGRQDDPGPKTDLDICSRYQTEND
jgi:hypothetical protein